MQEGSPAFNSLFEMRRYELRLSPDAIIESPFNSLFEMLCRRAETLRCRVDAAFNSLFEMRPRGGARAGTFRREAFNSLFEMQ